MYTLTHLLFLAPILTCALISASLITAPVKALPKMDQLKVWVQSSIPDVLVITETCLRKSVLNTDVNLFQLGGTIFTFGKLTFPK